MYFQDDKAELSSFAALSRGGPKVLNDKELWENLLIDAIAR